MNAQEVVNKLVDHLLGKDRYIVDPVPNEQANEIIYEEIISKYKSVDESPENRYRRRHKRCKWCRYCTKKYAPDNMPNVFVEKYGCDVKDKLVNPNTPRPFCSVYSPITFNHDLNHNK